MSLLDLKPETVSSTKSGGLLFAAFILVGGFFRMVLPSGGAPQNAPAKSPPKSAQTQQFVPARNAHAYEIAEKIGESFGCAETPDPSAPPESVNWRVPASSRPLAKFIIAFVPDPVHTHLSLLFDRDVEAMELAVPQIEEKNTDGTQNFVFDRSILPWRVPSPQGSAAPPSPEAAKIWNERERYPGLLIFRPNGNGDPTLATANTRACPPRETLFVFLVAETPTSGIRSIQFRNALQIMREIRAGSESKPKSLLLLGPNFSGSLDSLGRQLKQIPDAQNVSSVIAYSGTVTGDQSAFRQSFPENEKPKVRFASFQESDDYAIQMFIRFANSRGYNPEEIAILSEADTVYGNQAKTQAKIRAKVHAKSQVMKINPLDKGPQGPVYLNFPREISYFRSAYEKQLAAQPQLQQLPKLPGKSTLPEEPESDITADDEVARYANGQTPLAQEAVMLGLVSELQKHHVKFTVLLATNPVDQVFLARYLRTNYPQGRIVVTSPDLMLASQEDTLLFGVLGLNDYALVPGLNDSLCSLPVESGPHADLLFDSSSSVGIYNAMLGLTSISFGLADPDSFKEGYFVPLAPYTSYASPPVGPRDAPGCTSSPFLWLTILGRDGYWPIAALTRGKDKDTDSNTNANTDKDRQESAFHNLPVVQVELTSEKGSSPPSSSLPAVGGALAETNQERIRMHTVPAWNVTYSAYLAVIILHIILSLTGSFLSNSESKAQFARSHDRLGVIVLAMGAFWLATGFVLIMCTRSPLILWRDIPGLTCLLWSPLPVFAVLTFYDIAFLRKQLRIAWCFAAGVGLVALLQLLLVYGLIPFAPYIWSSRLIHFSSGVSPILPFLLLFISGYWWAWQSLRSISLVDLRRPRLPVASQLPAIAVRISDTEGELVRSSAHPLRVGWRIVAILGGVFCVSLTALELKHPLQSLEGNAFDRGYSLALGFAICVFLSCLIRLVFTWFDYKQVLSGLDRSPLREAFGRMKRLSWRSMWNPGGSTLRETYRVMSRALENMEHLKLALDKEKDRLSSSASQDSEEKKKIYVSVLGQIAETEKRVSVAQRIYRPLFPITDEFRAALPDGAEIALAEFETLLGKEEAALQKYEVFFVQNGRTEPDSAGIIERAKCAQAKCTVALEKYRLLRGRTQTTKILPSAGKFQSSANCLDTFVQLANLDTAPAEIFLAHFENTLMDQEPLVASLESVNDELFRSIGKEPKSKLEKICKEDSSKLVTGLMDSLEILQKQLANTAGAVFKKILDPLWKSEILPAISQDERIKRPELDMTRAVAEEFVALVYVNFLQSVLLQMRSLVICAGGMYVLILCSMSVYPFEPHPALQVLAVALVVVMAVAVGFVYAGMHRDAILSRLTSTTAGELGWDFWLKFISAAAIPVFSLLAVQFPEISKFLFSWLEPAMQAIK